MIKGPPSALPLHPGDKHRRQCEIVTLSESCKSCGSGVRTIPGRVPDCHSRGEINNNSRDAVGLGGSLFAILTREIDNYKIEFCNAV